MLEMTFAYLVATALLLSFKSTRWMGAIAVFLALFAAPVLSSVVLIFVAVGCYFIFGKPRWVVIRRRPPWGD
jgi:hypothetical protein